MKLWPRYSSYEIFKVKIGTNNSFAANLVHLFFRRISYLVYLETIDETAYLVQKCVRKCRPKNYHFIPVIIPSPDVLIWSNCKILFDLMFQLLTTIMGETAQKKTFSFSTLLTILFRMNLRRKWTWKIPPVTILWLFNFWRAYQWVSGMFCRNTAYTLRPSPMEHGSRQPDFVYVPPYGYTRCFSWYFWVWTRRILPFFASITIKSPSCRNNL
jgi:hypothetical protein